MMNKLLDTMKEKGMPFSFLGRYFRTYKLTLELQTKTPDKFLKIVPVIGAFPQLMSYIYVNYKRFLGSGISDLLVSAGLIEEGSVDQALRGTLQTGTVMHHAIARWSHSQSIED